MPRGRSWRWLVPAVALVALIGVWLGHTLEYVRVWGTSGLDREITSSTHLYMLPAGVGLTLLLALAAASVARVRRRLARRVENASSQLARAWRGTSAPVAAANHPGRLATPLSRRRLALILGITLAVLQVCLYLIQENVETALAGAPAPGLTAISAVHWAAPLILTGLGFLLAAVTVAIWSKLCRREAIVDRIERAVRAVLFALAARRVRPLLAPSAPLRHHGAPALLGTSIWCRPPPRPLIP